MGGMIGYTRAVAGDPDVSRQSLRLSAAGATKLFGDLGSGRAMERPGLTALLASSRPGDTLAVVRLDRLGCSLRDLLAIMDQLRERGIALLSLDDGIDTRPADAAQIFQVFGALAQCERQLIAERRRNALLTAQACGKRPGRPPLDTAKIAAAIRLVENGLTPAAAARKLRVGRSTIYREVRRAGIRRAVQRPGHTEDQP